VLALVSSTAVIGVFPSLALADAVLADPAPADPGVAAPDPAASGSTEPTPSPDPTAQAPVEPAPVPVAEDPAPAEPAPVPVEPAPVPVEPAPVETAPAEPVAGSPELAPPPEVTGPAPVLVEGSVDGPVACVAVSAGETAESACPSPTPEPAPVAPPATAATTVKAPSAQAASTVQAPTLVHAGGSAVETVLPSADELAARAPKLASSRRSTTPVTTTGATRKHAATVESSAPVLTPRDEEPPVLRSPFVGAASNAALEGAAGASGTSLERAAPPRIGTPQSLLTARAPLPIEKVSLDALTAASTSLSLTDHLPASTEPRSSTSGIGAGPATSRDGPGLPLPPIPPPDPSDNPTGLTAPGSGTGPQGAAGVIAIITALLLVFVPRLVRRLRPDGVVLPVGRFRVALERPG
jgi:hypothetical protein